MTWGDSKMQGPSFWEEFMPNTAVRKAIVTGASKGIGAVYARKLAKRGYDLVTVARNAARLEANASRIREETGRQVEVIVADLSKSAEVLKLAQRIAGDATVALLVNNAGVSSQGGVLQNTLADAERLIAVNITAPTLLSIAAAKAFAERGGGAVVNISSVTAFVPEVFDGAYSGSKNYLINLTISGRQDQGCRRALSGRSARPDRHGDVGAQPGAGKRDSPVHDHEP
jgi:uncharacterized protein